MTELARLSARERRRIIRDFVEDALDGVDAPAYRSGLLAATPDLPDDPTPEQIGAWIELAALVREPELRAALRRLAEYSSRTARAAAEPDAAGKRHATIASDAPGERHAAIEPRPAGEPDPAGQEQAAVRVAELMRVRGEEAVAAGIAPDSPAAEPVIAELVAAWLPTQTGTADPPPPRMTRRPAPGCWNSWRPPPSPLSSATGSCCARSPAAPRHPAGTPRAPGPRPRCAPTPGRTSWTAPRSTAPTRTGCCAPTSR
ncbi:hypothetical protein [Streptomyces sp. NPDC048637]|uniref:hypothetical protein n=1 Tax=Streptomyces sp. NPDC048637 TaxID=3155636 RepID=UPI0034456D5D